MDADSLYSALTTTTGGSSSTASSYQSSGSGGRSKAKDVRKRGVWSSMAEHVLVAMSPGLSMLQYQNYVLRDVGDGGTIVQVFVAYVAVAIPACYMQMVLGQYTHDGVFLLKRMAPIADGAGFAYCLTIFFLSLLQVLQVQDMCIYLMLTCVPGDLQWSRCGAANCWRVDEQCPGSEPCVDENVHVPAFVYWNETLMAGLSETEHRSLATPTAEAVVISLGLWIVIFLFTLVPIASLKKYIRRLTVAHLAMKTVAALALLLHVGVVRAFTHITLQAIINLTNLGAWREACIRAVVTLTLGDFGHVMVGALSADATRIGTVAFLAGMASFGSILVDDVTINAAAIVLCERANVDAAARHRLFAPADAPLHLTMMPTVFEAARFARALNMQFYANKCVAVLLRVIVNVHFLLESLAHRFPSLSSYKKYAASFFCGAAWAVGIVVQGNSAALIRENFRRVTVYACQHFNVFFFALMVSYVYGVRRFCDDVHFLRGSPPNLFWKLAWMLLPLSLAFTISVELFARGSPYFKESFPEMALMFSPYVVLTSLEFIKKIVEKKTITLIIPEARWGPREYERRVRRKHFNPRKATRYVMGGLNCRHVCLANDKTLRALVTKEAEIVSRLGGPRGAHDKIARKGSSLDMLAYMGSRGSVN